MVNLIYRVNAIQKIWKILFCIQQMNSNIYMVKQKTQKD